MTSTSSDSCTAIQSTHIVMTEHFIMAQANLVYSTEQLDDDSLMKFVALVKSKKENGWSAEMIETHLVANMSARIKQQYPRLRKFERIGIAEEMLQAILEKIIERQIPLS